MILFIDACVRENSRTRELAQTLLEKLGGRQEVVNLSITDLPTLDEKELEKRTIFCGKGNFSDPMFKYAKSFAEADNIVIAAPFWDLSFPAVLKKYIESICVSGITFKYSESGIPIGLCRANKLYYITTSGGPIINHEFGFGYIKALANSMFGIKDCYYYDAQNLDIVGCDVQEIMSKSKEAMIHDIESTIAPK